MLLAILSFVLNINFSLAVDDNGQSDVIVDKSRRQYWSEVGGVQVSVL